MIPKMTVKREKWYFSIADVCGVLTDQPDYQKARKYWNKLKERLVNEGNESVTNCHQLKSVARKAAEKEIGHSVVSDSNFLDKNPDSILIGGVEEE